MSDEATTVDDPFGEVEEQAVAPGAVAPAEEEQLGGWNPSEGDPAPGEEASEDDALTGDPDPVPAAVEPPASKPTDESDEEVAARLAESERAVAEGAAAAAADQVDAPVPGPDSPGTSPPVEPDEDGPKTQTRGYVVLEQDPTDSSVFRVRLWDDEEGCSKVKARNGENALRAAYRDLRQGRDSEYRPTIAVVSERQWKPKPVGSRQRANEVIEIG